MAGYPRVVGGGYVAGPATYPGTGYPVHGYVVGQPPAPPPPQFHPMLPMGGYGHAPFGIAVHPPPGVAIHSPDWRPMMAPGNPPLGEHHTPLPLTAETYGGTWGNTSGGGAPAGTIITFSARPQKPFKTTRLIARGAKSGTTAVGNIIAQLFVGTSLQQAELGFFDLESIGAATAFDTWISAHQAEPGVWIRVQATLTAFPTGTDFETYTVSALGHYLQ